MTNSNFSPILVSIVIRVSSFELRHLPSGGKSLCRFQGPPIEANSPFSLEEQGAADAAPSWFNRVVPPQGPPRCRTLLCRRGVTHAQAPRAPVNVREPARTKPASRWSENDQKAPSAAKGVLRSDPEQPYAPLVPRIHGLRMRDLGETPRRKCVRTVTSCHRTVTAGHVRTLPNARR